MDSRTAAHVLARIATYLQLRGESPFKARAYASAAREVRALSVADLAPLYRSGELGKIRGLGPATLAVIGDLVERGASRYLDQLEAAVPPGLVEMLAIPGLRAPRIRQIHDALGIETVGELEAAALDGRLGTVRAIGPRTVQRILNGIVAARARGTHRLFHHALAEARSLVASIRDTPGVRRAEVAGALRRRVEIVDRIEIVVECETDPVAMARSLARLPGASAATAQGASVAITFVDGAHVDVHCATPQEFGGALWRATGNDAHIGAVLERLVERGVIGSTADSRIPSFADETALYRAAGLPFIEPELREGCGEVEAAVHAALPTLVETSDVLGTLHCHTLYSDGKASVAEMVRGARERGWQYIGITDHSQSAYFAGGMPLEKLVAQLAEIDELNAGSDGFRVLKGVEADILVDGRLDYDAETLDRFDFVVGSVHSQFALGQAAMTERVLRALDDPHLTILGHPTGRLLLARDAYAIDVEAVIEKAAEVGAAVELNADPRRLDLDWRYVRRAKERGATVAIGPDAHSVAALDNVEVGVGLARKGWLERGDVLNARSAAGVLSFARARRHRD
jgi:DNA polymerase (family 10)